MHRACGATVSQKAIIHKAKNKSHPQELTAQLPLLAIRKTVYVLLHVLLAEVQPATYIMFTGYICAVVV